jgi:dihydroorotate dehydrogenase electron transfer subunit
VDEDTVIIDPHAEIIEKTKWNDFIRFRIKSQKIASGAAPGQFLMIRVSQQPHPLLRRPLCVHDKEKDTIAVFFQITGTGTELLSRKQKGDCLDILGPLGNGFFIPRKSSRTSILVGGGRGIAPLIFLARIMQSRELPYHIYYGAQSIAGLPLKDELEQTSLFCTTEDSSFGTPGLITSLLDHHLDAESQKPERIYACGPEAMLESVARISFRYQIPAQLSLESLMGCGFGVCWGCVKRMKKNGQEGWVKICQNGPVVRAQDLVWSHE